MLDGWDITVRVVAGVSDVLCQFRWIRGYVVLVRIALGMLSSSGADDNLYKLCISLVLR